MTQDPATNGVVYVPAVWETTKGSEGMSGAFEIDFEAPLGSSVALRESAKRFERKLEEMLTVGGVAVERLPYPSAASGGWGDVAVALLASALGWLIVHQEPGRVPRLHTFPPGAGNLDSITVDGHGLQGNAPVGDRGAGSDRRLAGRSRSASAHGPTMSGRRRTTRWSTCSSGRTPSASAAGGDRTSRCSARGLWATVDRDGATASLRYDGTFGAGRTLETVLADALGPGGCRLGGDRAVRGAGRGRRRHRGWTAWPTRRTRRSWARPRRRWATAPTGASRSAARRRGDPLRRRGAAPLRGRGRRRRTINASLDLFRLRMMYSARGNGTTSSSARRRRTSRRR